MRAFKISNDSDLSLEEKIKEIETYDKDDLLYIQKQYEKYPEDYSKEIILAVHNKLFSLGVTSI